MLTAFESVVVDVTDFESARRAYALLLGREPIEVDFDPAQGTRIARFALANAALELRAIPERGADGAATIGLREADGIAGIRLAGVFDSGDRLRPGRAAGPTVPIELIGSPASVASWPASGDDESGGRVEGLDHVVIASPDPEPTSRHLAEDLGLRRALDRRFPERGLRLIFFRIGGVTLEIASPLAAPAPPTPATGGDAFHGLAWKVSRIDALHARLGAAGFALSAVRDGHKAGTRVASLRGALHGVPTLLIEHPPHPAGDPPGARAGGSA